MDFIRRIFDFFRGTYGNDQLNIALLCVYLLVSVANCFFRSWIFAIPEIALLIIIFFRMFSKKIYKRKAENEKFLTIFNALRRRVVQAYNSVRFHKNFLYKTCPKCHARLRMTRRRGRHTVKCPVCQNEFEVRIL